MKRFTTLYNELDASTRTMDKLDALETYFRQADPRDAAWAVAMLCGNRPRRPVNSRFTREWIVEASGIPDWLYQECYEAVGDQSETMALLLDQVEAAMDYPLHYWMEQVILPLREMSPEQQKEILLAAWKGLSARERFLFNKLIGGSFRVGVSEKLVARALARIAGVDEQVIAHRMMGNWQPTPNFYQSLLDADTRDADISRPYPFYLAYALEEHLHSLGSPQDWVAEWKWDGIRCQLIQRGDTVFIWSRGEELVTERYPELVSMGQQLPAGTVLDGELIAWKEDAPLPFNQLQRRIGRKTAGKKLQQEVPVVLLAYDLLEWEGRDLRQEALQKRQLLLRKLVTNLQHPTLLLSDPVVFEHWEQLHDWRALSREKKAEGLMLKRADSIYQAGRRRGDWWKWKTDPLQVDAVLIYAQRGTGRRANMYTDYTFAVWDGDKLVSFAKAYSGLTDAEIKRVDAFIKQNTLEKFGPVRTVRPELVFELAFEGIQLSPRHKSGVAVRFPRISRWRTDKKPEEADTLEQVKKLAGL